MGCGESSQTVHEFPARVIPRRGLLRGRSRLRTVLRMQEFEPHPLLGNAHAMTLAGTLWPRRRESLHAGVPRRFEVEPGSFLLGMCHWQPEPRAHATLVLIHGLEGSAGSPYMIGAASLGFARGFNAVRLNQRNCGATEHLTPTLYNSGLSGDLRAVVAELLENDGLPEVFVAGFSMGGNLAVKYAGELGPAPPRGLRGVVGVCPALELAACIQALERPANRLYEWHFVRSLKARMRRKAQLYPERYRLDGLARVRSVRQFDEVITAPHCGYRDAADYYYRAAAMRVVGKIQVPTLILAAQDDPLVPFTQFAHPDLVGHAHVRLVAPEHGGHCAFVSRQGGAERFWAEARLVEFCAAQSALAS